MNNCYRLVFDESRGMLVPVAELKAARGKGRGRACGGPRLSAVALLVASLVSECWPGAARAGGAPIAASQAQSLLPQSGRVVAGSAQITTASVDQMVIDQSSHRAVIDWQSFNIGAGDTVRFAQPSSTAQALNRVVGLAGTTQILGKLTANGQVFIVNPQGVVFGKGAVVDTAALLATTHDIAPSAFMTHGVSLLLSGGSNGTGLVDNEGTLSTAPGGWVALVGDQVKNSGSIAAPAGTVALAAGAEATLALANGQLVSLKLDRAAANAQVIDSGTIRANGAAGTRAGQVLISADTAQSLLDQAINITGVVQAGGGTANRGGQVTVDGGANGTVSLQNATLTVASAAGAGGQVSVTGRQVTLYDSRLNASGATGGGTILVGGGAHGGAIGAPDAVVTTVAGGSSLDASATGNGNGGQVVLWSNDRTDFGGTILSGGGASGGNGGNVEVSSHGSVSFTGNVDTRAPRGSTGSLLLDPTNINVANGAAGAPNSTTVDGSSGSVTITDGEISAELTNTSVTLSATGNLTDTASTVVSGANASSVLTLSAANITVYGGYNVSGGMALIGSRAIVFDGPRIETGASNLTARANTVAFSGNTVIGGGSLNISGVNGAPAYAVTFSSGSVTNLSASSGSVLVSGSGVGGILMNAGSTINVVGNGTFNGTVNGWDGGISVGCGTSSNASALVVINSSNGSLTLNGSNAHGDGIGINDVVDLSGNQTWLGRGTCGGRGIDFGGLCNIQTLPYAINVLSGTVNFSSPGSVSAFQSGFSASIQNISAGSGAVVTLGAVTGSPALNIGGPGTVVLDANNPSLSGSITVRGGTLQVGNGGASGTLGTARVIDDGAVVVNYGAAVSLSAVAACTSGITGNGNFTAVSTGALTIDRALNLSGGNGTVLLAAGCATAAANSGGGNVTLTSPVSVGAGGTVIVFSGNPNTTTLEGQLSGASGATQYKTYDADYTDADGAVPGTHNFYYRGADSISLSATGTLALKTYDATDDAAGDINAGAVDVLESVTDGNNISFSSLAAGSAAFGSAHSLGVDGSTVAVSFGNTAHFSANGTNWSVAGLTVGNLSGNGTITPASLTLTATSQAKSYDGTDSAAGLETVSGLIATDTLSNAALAEAYISPHVLGTDGSTLNVAAPLSNASFAAGSHGYITDYNVDYVTATGTVTPASLTLTAISQTKIYDGTDGAAGLATVAGLVATDTLSNAALTQAYSSPHALGTDGSTLNVATALSNASFGSGSVGHIADYSVDYVTAPGTVTPASLTLTATSQTKTYDGTDGAASLATVSGLVSTDSLINAAPAQAYSSPHVLGANGSTLNVATALSNASFGSGSVGHITDYSVDYVTAPGTVTPASLTLTATSQTKTYDGTDGAASLATVSGLVSTDSLINAALAQAYTSPHVLGASGSTLNIAAALTDASFASGSVGHMTDYAVTYVTANGTITPAALDVAPGSTLTLYDMPMATLADMSGNVQPGQGYVSDYSPNVINNGNLTFAGPDDATLVSLTGTGNLTVDANMTVTGAFTQKSATVDGEAMLTYPGSGVAGQMQPVESGISTVEWARNGTTIDTHATPASSGISAVDGVLCRRPKQGSKVCR